MVNLPDIWLYNPTCDFATGNGKPSWQPNKLLQKMEDDLSALPLFLANSNDYILTAKLPSAEYLAMFKQLNIETPQFIEKKEAFSDAAFLAQPKCNLQPWGWSPAAHKLLSPLKANCSEEFKQSPVFNWLPAHRDLYSRKFASSVLQKMLENKPGNVFMSSDYTPRICTQQLEIEAALSDWQTLMIKAPWSSSGRGLQPISKTPVHPKVWEKVFGIINTQGYVMVEPLLDKQLDIAFQFEILKGKVTYLGISNFTTDSKGQYTGNNLNGLPDSIDEDLKKFALNLPGLLIDPLISVLGKSELATLFEGKFGVDALIFRNAEGRLRVNPCLEINLRYNMGLLSLQLEKLLVPGKKAMYRTWFDSGKNFASFKKEMQFLHPLLIENGKIASGFFSLTDADEDSRFGAYILA